MHTDQVVGHPFDREAGHRAGYDEPLRIKPAGGGKKPVPVLSFGCVACGVWRVAGGR